MSLDKDKDKERDQGLHIDFHRNMITDPLRPAMLVMIFIVLFQPSAGITASHIMHMHRPNLADFQSVICSVLQSSRLTLQIQQKILWPILIMQFLINYFMVKREKIFYI